MKIGDRIFITDQKHPWIGHGGEVVSDEEIYGLGWRGFRVKIDDTCGHETYVRRDQIMETGRVDRMTITTRTRKGRTVR